MAAGIASVVVTSHAVEAETVAVSAAETIVIVDQAPSWAAPVGAPVPVHSVAAVGEVAAEDSVVGVGVAVAVEAEAAGADNLKLCLIQFW